MSSLSKLSRDLYLASRTASDANTLNRQGPQALAKKLIRRRARREGYALLRRWSR